jgi:hypothetical protein
VARRTQVKNREAAKTEAERAAEVKALIVGTAMFEHPSHPDKSVAIDRQAGAEIKLAGYTTHGCEIVRSCSRATVWMRISAVIRNNTQLN